MKRSRLWIVAAVAALAIVPAACAPTGGEPEIVMESETKTLFVGPQQVDCTGVAPQKCLQVREEPDGEYLLFYSNIEGFAFEPGYEYELRVQVDPVENAPADASSLRYTLIELVSKTPVAAEAGDAGGLESMEKNELTGVLWTLVSYLNADGEMTEALPQTNVTLEFGPEGRVGGNGGCNTYFAGYTVDGDSLTFGQAGSTMMACEEAIMAQEAAYLAALQSTATFTVEGDALRLADAGGETVLVFQAEAPVSLAGTNWTGSMVNTGTEAVTGVMAGTTITAAFTEDGKLSGSAGCNTYMTGYTLDGNNITIQPPATTRKLCPEPAGIMEQEAAFVNMLPQAATYTISGDKLELRTADGALIASFVAAQ